MIAQLVDITFENAKGETMNVSWYHVPRVGDHLEVVDAMANPGAPMVGKVVRVLWTEDSVWVTVK